MNGPTCLLVIPSYRDTIRLGPFLRDLMTSLPSAFQILVVDDGSGQAGLTALQELIRREQTTEGHTGPMLLDPLILAHNVGKGGAIYHGWRSGPTTDLLAFADADGAVSAREIVRIWTAWPDLRADAVIASRVRMLGRQVERLAVRHYAGRVFATLVAIFTGLSVYDSQCGFKMLRRDCFLAADRRGLLAERFAFDVELLVALAKARCRVVEIPVDWRDVPGGSVSLARHSVPMLRELVGIRCRHGRVQ